MVGRLGAGDSGYRGRVGGGGLMVSWACLATVYCLPAWLIGFFANRDCSLGGSWRLAGAALMPGALLMCAVIVLYGWGALDLVRLAVAGSSAFVVGLGLPVDQPPVLAAAPGGGGEGQSVRVIACCAFPRFV